MAPAIPLLAALVTAGGAVAATTIGNKKPKAAAVTPTPKPVVGESTTLKPGEKVNAIMTTPQGILDSATTGRQTLLGG